MPWETTDGDSLADDQRALLDEKATDVIDTTDTTATDAIAHSHAKDLEREVLGAWRAGYDYLHVYSEHNTRFDPDADRERFTITRWVIPTDAETPLTPRGYRYNYSYALHEADREDLEVYL